MQVRYYSCQTVILFSRQSIQMMILGLEVDWPHIYGCTTWLNTKLRQSAEAERSNGKILVPEKGGCSCAKIGLGRWENG